MFITIVAPQKGDYLYCAVEFCRRRRRYCKRPSHTDLSMELYNFQCGSYMGVIVFAVKDFFKS